MKSNESDATTERLTQVELEKTTALLDITRNKLFTAMVTVTELELLISLDRQKIEELTKALATLDSNKTV